MNVKTVNWLSSRFSGTVEKREDGTIVFTNRLPFAYTAYAKPDDGVTALDVDLSTITVNSIPVLKLLLSRLWVTDCLYTLTDTVVDADGSERKATFNFYADEPAVDFTVEGENPGSLFAVYEDSLYDDVKKCLESTAVGYDVRNISKKVVDALTILADGDCLSQYLASRG